MNDARTAGRGSVALGIVLLIPLHVVGQGVIFAIGMLTSEALGPVSLLGIGLSQLVYVVPAAVVAKRRGAPAVAKGLLIAAAVTFLLNAACFGLVFASNFRIGG
jgi:hypothetical protein